MALNIKNPETERLARELAAKTGESITQAVTHAIEERLSRHRKRTEAEIQAEVEQMRRIAHRVASLPTLDTRSEDEILGYNEYGGFD